MHKNIKKFGLLFIGVLALASTACAPRVFASTIASQTVASTNETMCASYHSSFTQSLGTGLSGTYKSLALQFNVAGATTVDVVVYGNTNADGHSGTYDTSGAGGSDTPDVITASGDQAYTFQWAAGHTFNSSYYYWFYVYTTGANMYPLGSFTDVFGTGAGMQGDCNTSLGVPSGMAYSTVSGYDNYFDFDTLFSPLADTTNRITLEAPSDSSITGGTSVTISGHYYENSSVTFSRGSFTGVHIHLVRNDGAFGVYAPIDIVVPESVTDLYTTWTTTYTLPTGSNWTATAFLEFGTPVYVGSYIDYTPYDLYSAISSTFSVVSYPTGSVSGIPTPPSVTYCSGFGFGMNDLCSVIVWAFVPTSDSISQFKTLTLAHSFPFSYLYDLPVLINEVYANPSGIDYTITIPWQTTTITLISPAMISAIPFASTAKTLLGYVFIFTTCITLYHITIKSHDKTK